MSKRQLPTHTEILVSFSRHDHYVSEKEREAMKERGETLYSSVYMMVHPSVEHVPRDRKVYRLSVPVPPGAFDEHDDFPHAGEAEIVRMEAGKCNG